MLLEKEMKSLFEDWLLSTNSQKVIALVSTDHIEGEACYISVNI